jgi:hypothetical protein
MEVRADLKGDAFLGGYGASLLGSLLILAGFWRMRAQTVLLLISRPYLLNVKSNGINGKIRKGWARSSAEAMQNSGVKLEIQIVVGTHDGQLG